MKRERTARETNCRRPPPRNYPGMVEGSPDRLKSRPLIARTSVRLDAFSATFISDNRTTSLTLDQAYPCWWIDDDDAASAAADAEAACTLAPVVSSTFCHELFVTTSIIQ